jgi:hypothetical protein
MSRRGIHRITHATNLAASDVTIDRIVSFDLAPTLAGELSSTCSTTFLSALFKRIELLQETGNTIESLPKNNEVLTTADFLYRHSSTVGGITGIVLGAAVPVFLFYNYFERIELQISFFGVFFPGVPFAIALSGLFKSLSFTLLRPVRDALKMAYGVHLEVCQREQYWRSLHWREYEKEVARLFRKNGFDVRETPGTGDKGVDFIAKRNGKQFVAQCKNHSKTIGPNVVRELIGTVVSQRADAGILIATCGFSSGAVQAANGVPVILLDVFDLLELQKHSSFDSFLDSNSLETVSEVSVELLSPTKSAHLEGEALLSICKNLEGFLGTARFWPDFSNPNGDIPDIEAHFNFNDLFKIFDQLILDEDMVLDYIMFRDHDEGRPLIYVRRKSEMRIRTADEYFQRFSFTPDEFWSWSQDRSKLLNDAYLKWIRFPRSILGCFHYALFSIVSDQMNLYWHTNYARREWFAVAEDFVNSVRKFEKSMKPADTLRLLTQIDIRPEVELDSIGAAVTIVTLRDKHEYNQSVVRIRFPSTYEGIEDTPLVSTGLNILY